LNLATIAAASVVSVPLASRHLSKSITVKPDSRVKQKPGSHPGPRASAASSATLKELQFAGFVASSARLVSAVSGFLAECGLLSSPAISHAGISFKASGIVVLCKALAVAFAVAIAFLVHV
jgi:hypothetical protein